MKIWKKDKKEVVAVVRKFLSNGKPSFETLSDVVGKNLTMEYQVAVCQELCKPFLSEFKGVPKAVKELVLEGKVLSGRSSSTVRTAAFSVGGVEKGHRRSCFFAMVHFLDAALEGDKCALKCCERFKFQLENCLAQWHEGKDRTRFEAFDKMWVEKMLGHSFKE